MLQQPTSRMDDSAPRLAPKRSGLFDEDLMSDTLVGDKLDTYHILGNLESEDANLSFHDAELGDLFGDAVTSWGDGTCLDSFVDLSQFLDIQGISEKETASEFSTIDVDSAIVSFSTADCNIFNEKPAKRKRAGSRTRNSTSDHDYIIKKPRREQEPKTNDSESEDENLPVMMDDDTDREVTRMSSKDKYRERRQKNNIASRRSREIRKTKLTDLEQEGVDLEIKNNELRIKIVELESLAKEMKASLIQKLVSK